MNALELSHVTMPGRLADVSLQLPLGELVGVVGPNGSGKSTLLQLAAGVLPGTGEVRWGERPLPEIPMLERGRLAAWVPQEAKFSFGFTVRSVVAQGRFAHGDDAHGVEDVLARFNLLALADRPVDRLSGGEKHRVLLARAVVTEAPLQFWDEPLAALDVRHALETVVLARELAQAGKTVVLSLHDLRAATRLDRVIVLHGGRLRASGKPEAVLTPTLLEDVFGVRTRIAPGLVVELP
ncbi:ABC transporter ATP-binding protein [Opitutus sp. ER46]|uniref:ABC transporter ATP-binding protein n=1 Tax=Opitutus sp. ER46 TaxID=2161864 RepID=UPI000D312941|nr:ABC transporter ATP-binding protein [Opitutus sp. ER46]PTX92384.1 ABC transporter ATP-binding protein [Opitutus sp. ER46]